MMRILIRLLTALALVSPITGGALPAAAQEKVRLLLDFMADRCQRMIRGALAPIEPSRLA